MPPDHHETRVRPSVRPRQSRRVRTDPERGGRIVPDHQDGAVAPPIQPSGDGARSHRQPAEIDDGETAAVVAECASARPRPRAHRRGPTRRASGAGQHRESSRQPLQVGIERCRRARPADGGRTATASRRGDVSPNRAARSPPDGSHSTTTTGPGAGQVAASRHASVVTPGRTLEREDAATTVIAGPPAEAAAGAVRTRGQEDQTRPGRPTRPWPRRARRPTAPRPTPGARSPRRRWPQGPRREHRRLCHQDAGTGADERGGAGGGGRGRRRRGRRAGDGRRQRRARRAPSGRRAPARPGSVRTPGTARPSVPDPTTALARGDRRRRGEVTGGQQRAGGDGGGGPLALDQPRRRRPGCTRTPDDTDTSAWPRSAAVIGCPWHQGLFDHDRRRAVPRRGVEARRTSRHWRRSPRARPRRRGPVGPGARRWRRTTPSAGRIVAFDAARRRARGCDR